VIAAPFKAGATQEILTEVFVADDIAIVGGAI
jgi:hypothetical protein